MKKELGRPNSRQKARANEAAGRRPRVTLGEAGKRSSRVGQLGTTTLQRLLAQQCRNLRLVHLRTLGTRRGHERHVVRRVRLLQATAKVGRGRRKAGADDGRTGVARRHLSLAVQHRQEVVTVRLRPRKQHRVSNLRRGLAVRVEADASLFRLVVAQRGRRMAILFEDGLRRFNRRHLRVKQQVTPLHVNIVVEDHVVDTAGEGGDLKVGGEQPREAGKQVTGALVPVQLVHRVHQAAGRRANVGLVQDAGTHVVLHNDHTSFLNAQQGHATLALVVERGTAVQHCCQHRRHDLLAAKELARPQVRRLG
mmetsp:Transcript_10056/g.31857  ORF Transcript_10056/g.31857 Transcript_10056/m.31857 type:complete len:309 (-) Transcript_10056:2821-3747(-)